MVKHAGRHVLRASFAFEINDFRTVTQAGIRFYGEKDTAWRMFGDKRKTPALSRRGFYWTMVLDLETSSD